MRARHLAFALVGLAGLALGPAAGARTPTPACPGGRFVVDGPDLLDGAVLPGPDSVFLTPASAAVASGCATGPAKVKGSKRGTTLKATFESCAGATGKVKLKARIDPACQTMTGTLSARKSKLKRDFSAAFAPSAVRACAFVPGVSVPATMPPGVDDPPPPPPPIVLPAPTPVPPEKTAAQLQAFDALWNAVNDHYVDPAFHGVDWAGVGTQYRPLVEQGLSDPDFGLVMQAMIDELGDQHSYFQTAQQVADEDAAMAAGKNFVGIGVLALPIPGHTDTGSIIVTFPGSPAEEAGLEAHDALLAVDGLPVRDEFGVSRTLGPDGSSFDLTYQRPGEASQTISLARRPVHGFLPIDRCIVPGTQIGYVLLPTFLDPTVDDQLRMALQDMTLPGPLDGLVLDQRENGGGLGSVADATLGFFTSGLQGQFVNRDSQAEPLDIVAEDVGGSQTVPLVVLIGLDTVSYGEVVSGILGRSGRATLLGSRTLGNVEQLVSYDFPDGSRAWLATRTFEPLGLAPGAWDGVGIAPDLTVPARWDLFREETDPGLAAAVERLQAP